MGVNRLPKTVTRQRRGCCDLNPGPSAPESSTLTTRLPSHPRMRRRHATHLLQTTRGNARKCKRRLETRPTDVWHDSLSSARTVLLRPTTAARPAVQLALIRSGTLQQLFATQTISSSALVLSISAVFKRFRMSLLSRDLSKYVHF